MEKISPTAAISGWPLGVLGSISTEDRMLEPMNRTQANRARTTFRVVSLMPLRKSSYPVSSNWKHLVSKVLL